MGVPRALGSWTLRAGWTPAASADALLEMLGFSGSGGLPGVVFWRTRFGFEFLPRGAAHSNDDIHFMMRHDHCRMPKREEKFDNGALLAGACETGVSLFR